jgi:hypothetical protein
MCVHPLFASASQMIAKDDEHAIDSRGEWIAYRLSRVNDTAELHIRKLTAATPVIVTLGDR